MDIVEELRQDREAGAKRLESEYRAGLLAMARRLCSDLSDADELVNRTFAAVVAGIDDYLEQSAFFGWMCRIMINLNSADRRRRSDRDVTYPGDLPETPDDAAHEAIYRDVDASILRDAINTLPKEMKEAIVMHYLMEQPVARIAKFLALPVSTVKWRIHCARVELTRRLTSSAKKPGVKAQNPRRKWSRALRASRWRNRSRRRKSIRRRKRNRRRKSRQSRQNRPRRPPK